MRLPVPAAVRVLLCDADGTLFPSEEPAFEASADVTNRLLAELGSATRYEAEELRRATSGKNFRTTAADLAAAAGADLPPEMLERWVAEERRRVVAHLRRRLAPDPLVVEPLRALAADFELAVVTSSAAARLDACLGVTGLDELFPSERMFSAEDSLPRPESKPSPAIYRLAGQRLDVAGDEALAVEDTVTGARSALDAGFPTVGFVMFVPPPERQLRIDELREAGAAEVVGTWRELAELLETPVVEMGAVA
jgi:beta-phosphoglucomutase-like phosphatase (HAD superfamily)